MDNMGAASRGQDRVALGGPTRGFRSSLEVALASERNSPALSLPVPDHQRRWTSSAQPKICSILICSPVAVVM